MVKRLLAFAAVGTGAMGGWGAFGCGAKTPQAQEAKRVVPELSLSEVRFHLYRGGEVTAAGDARRATYVRESSDASAESVHATVPRAGERGELRVPADR